MTIFECAAEEFAQLAIELHDEPSLDDTIEKVLEFALDAINADHAGVVLVHAKKRLETAAVTDAVVAEIDAFQISVGEGPNLTVLDDRLIVSVSDTCSDSRWPAWARKVTESGIRSVLSVRMYTTETTVGTLNLYSRRPDAFDVDDQAVAHILARHAAVALSTAIEQKNLGRAVDARKRIGQAQGILMERFDLDPDQAFAVLVRYSQHNNIKLRLVADTIIETRALPG
jgi:GAF domain-containing protein